jgi:hypothetical protein
MPLRLLAATSLAFALSAVPAPAATLDPLKPCYVSTGTATEQLEDVVVHGVSFTPETTVYVYRDGIAYGDAPTDAVGDFTLFVDAPHQPKGERPFTITATDGVNTVSVQSRVTNLAVFVRPRRAAPSRRVRFRGRGFMQAAPVYAHYLYRNREHKTVQLAPAPAAPCGTFSAKRRQIPVKNARTGRWTVQIDQKKAYSEQPDPVWVRLPITVRETFGLL